MILLFIYLVFVGVGLPDSLLGAAWPFISGELSVSVDSAGTLSVMISIGIIAASLAASRFERRLGFFRCAALGLALLTLALTGYVLARSTLAMALCSLPLGFGSGMLQTLFNEYVAENYTARHMSWLHGTWGLGAITGPLLVAWLAPGEATWRGSYVCVAAAELLLLALLGIIMLDGKNRKKIVRSDGGQTPSHFSLRLLKGKLCMIGQYFLYCSMENSVMLWGASYLVAAKGMDSATAASGASIFFAGITIGRFIGGILLTRLDVTGLLRGCVAACAVMCAILFLSGSTLVALGALFLLGCCMAPIYPATLYLSPTYFPDEDQQLLMGIQVASAYVGILILPPLLGKLFAGVSFSLLPAVLAAGLFGVLLCVMRLKKQAARNAGP